MSTSARDAPPAPKSRDRERTQRELQLAMLRVKNKGLKLSIAAVASEAGVTPSLIHNTYPDFAEEIRAQLGRATRKQRDAKAADLADARSELKRLRVELNDARRDIAKLASINETLTDEVASLRAQVAGKVIGITGRRDG